MSITTYTELKSAIADFLNRDDLDAVAPTFIALAEADINRRIRHWRMEKRASATLDTQHSAVPSDFIEAIRYHVSSNDTWPLELISQSEMLDRRGRSQNAGGRPLYYAMTAGEIEVFPSPDGDYTTELYYYGKTDALGDSQATNWLLTNFPDVYLYGALMHSAPYLKDDARLQVWAMLYQSAVDGVNMDGDSGKFGGSGRRMKIRSY